ncbi:MAG: serine/threonine protein kinase [Chitinispirillaceae bacterium]|jgi:Ser/Thr protein kinase RdoA (MazF antagonist)|nr:serine/threonine protein kinase [Chitinispirillaceae bacterium]
MTAPDNSAPVAPKLGVFDSLTLDLILESVEAALGVRLTGMVSYMSSYINRVCALQTATGDGIVAKFYRPGRWSVDAIREEHDFVLACAEAEIPVIAPLPLVGKSTLGSASGIPFAVYPKRWGRPIEVEDDEMWERLGTVIARMHLAGSQAAAPHRVVLHPEKSLRKDIQDLLDGNFVQGQQLASFTAVCDDILALTAPLFDDVKMIRLHGDCHCGNILNRPGEGLMLIDFDDMATGPPVQDLWLMLPGDVRSSALQLSLMLDGYEQFRDFDRSSLRLVEPLRAMRLIYFLAWCGRQMNDHQFRHHFPKWGTPGFWDQEIADLQDQLQQIKKALDSL